MKKLLKKLLDIILLLCTFGGNIADEAVELGLCDFSGQGRDKHGK